MSHDIFQFFIYGEEKEKQKLCQLNLRMLMFFEAYMLKVFLSLIVFQLHPHPRQLKKHEKIDQNVRPSLKFRVSKYCLRWNAEKRVHLCHPQKKRLHNYCFYKHFTTGNRLDDSLN